MIEVINDFVKNSILNEEEYQFIENVYSNSKISETPVKTPKKGTNYYNRFFLNINSEVVQSIREKITKITEEILKKNKSINNSDKLLLIGDMWINKVDIDSNKDDDFHHDSSPFTTILYLNDNYEGGWYEYIDSENSNKLIKPKTNQLIIADKQVKHRVLPVTNGVRYSLVAFFKKKDKEQKTII